MGIRILVADDHAVIRAGMKALIQSDPELIIVAEASGGLETINLFEENTPDVVVLDISMPDMDGILITKELKTKYPNVKILILTVHEDEAMLREVMRFGASGYILKHAAEEELIEAIKKIHAGEMYVDQKMLPSLIGQRSLLRQATKVLAESLTPRETDVLRLIVNGYTNRQVGEELGISVRTVEGHRANIYGKLNLNSRVELVRFAKKHNLV